MLKILKIYFYFMDYHNTFQKKIWGYRINYLSGEPNLTPPHRLHADFYIKSSGVAVSVHFTSLK